MTELLTARVAAVQATPVVLDAEASVAKAAELIGEAARRARSSGRSPETFVPLCPSARRAQSAGRGSRAPTSSGSGSGRTRWRCRGRSWTDRSACREYGVHCAIGVNERESERPGTL